MRDAGVYHCDPMAPRLNLKLLAFASVLTSLACNTPGIETAREQTKPLVDAACGWMFGCCSEDELVYQIGDFTVGADDCSERLLDAISTGVPLGLEEDLSDDPAQALLLLALSINEKRVEVNEELVAGCSTATTAMACNMPTAVDPGERCTPGSALPPDPCDPTKMFVGLQELGEPCDGAWECAAGLRCIEFSLAGVCAARTGVGGNCFSDAECGEDLICDYRSGSCAVGAQLSQACSFSDPANPIAGTEEIRCADGLSCDPIGLTCVGGFCAPGSSCFDQNTDTDCPEGYFCVGNFDIDPSCQLPGDLGAPCVKNLDCASGACDQNNQVCATLLTDGSPCFASSECESNFCDNNTNTCAPTFGPGQPCMSFNSDECNGGFCDTSDPLGPTCQAYANEGGACPFGNECDPSVGLSCVDMVCLQPPFPDGTTCFGPQQCESGVCYLDQCTAGIPAGAACATDGSTEPCVLGAFCETLPTSVDGTCAQLRRSGEACASSDQCWGECIVRFGSLMCDSTPAYALGELWCDGQ
jgi:hypothetical protein